MKSIKGCVDKMCAIFFLLTQMNIFADDIVIGNYIKRENPDILEIDSEWNLWCLGRDKGQVAITKFDRVGNLMFEKRVVPFRKFPEQIFPFDYVSKIVEINPETMMLIGTYVDVFESPGKTKIMLFDKNGKTKGEAVLINIHGNASTRIDEEGKIHMFSGFGRLSDYARIEVISEKAEVKILARTPHRTDFWIPLEFTDYFPEFYVVNFSFEILDGKKALICVKPTGIPTKGKDFAVDEYIAYHVSLGVHNAEQELKGVKLWDETESWRNIERNVKSKPLSGGVGFFDFSDYQRFRLKEYAQRKFENAKFPFELVRLNNGDFLLNVPGKDEAGVDCIYQIRFDKKGIIMKPSSVEISEVKELTDSIVLKRVFPVIEKSVSGPLPRVIVYGIDGEGYIYMRKF